MRTSIILGVGDLTDKISNCIGIHTSTITNPCLSDYPHVHTRVFWWSGWGIKSRRRSAAPLNIPRLGSCRFVTKIAPDYQKKRDGPTRRVPIPGGEPSTRNVMTFAKRTAPAHSKSLPEPQGGRYANVTTLMAPILPQIWQTIQTASKSSESYTELMKSSQV